MIDLSKKPWSELGGRCVGVVDGGLFISNGQAGLWLRGEQVEGAEFLDLKYAERVREWFGLPGRSVPWSRFAVPLAKYVEMEKRRAACPCVDGLLDKLNCKCCEGEGSHGYCGVSCCECKGEGFTGTLCELCKPGLVTVARIGRRDFDVWLLARYFAPVAATAGETVSVVVDEAIKILVVDGGAWKVVVMALLPDDDTKPDFTVELTA